MGVRQLILTLNGRGEWHGAAVLCWQSAGECRFWRREPGGSGGQYFWAWLFWTVRSEELPVTLPSWISMKRRICSSGRDPEICTWSRILRLTVYSNKPNQTTVMTSDIDDPDFEDLDDSHASQKLDDKKTRLQGACDYCRRKKGLPSLLLLNLTSWPTLVKCERTSFNYQTSFILSVGDRAKMPAHMCSNCTFLQIECVHTPRVKVSCGCSCDGINKVNWCLLLLLETSVAIWVRLLTPWRKCTFTYIPLRYIRGLERRLAVMESLLQNVS